MNMHLLEKLTDAGTFQPAAASFVSAARGVVLGCSGRDRQALLAVTADGGGHWSMMERHLLDAQP